MYPSSLRLEGIAIVEGRRLAMWDTAGRRRIAEARGDLENSLRKVLSPFCTHVKGNGGVKGTVHAVQTKLPEYAYVARFDVEAYYDNIDHAVLMRFLENAGVSLDLLRLVRQYLEIPDTAHSGRGLTAGGSFSSLLAALYLLPLDRVMEDLSADGRIFYRRFMDDFIVLADTHGKLRRIIRRVHRELAALGLRAHGKKRFIGRTTSGFDFLGYRLHPNRRLRPSAESVRRLKERARRLYEQGASRPRLRQYVTRWWRWLWGGLEELVCGKGGVKRYWVWICTHLDINALYARN